MTISITPRVESSKNVAPRTQIEATESGKTRLAKGAVQRMWIDSIEAEFNSLTQKFTVIVKAVDLDLAKKFEVPLEDITKRIVNGIYEVV